MYSLLTNKLTNNSQLFINFIYSQATYTNWSQHRELLIKQLRRNIAQLVQAVEPPAKSVD